MTKSLLAGVKVPKASLTPFAWGGGHTSETDPTSNGWVIARAHKDSRVWVIGQKGVEGCASLLPIDGKRLDVAVYLEAPEVISARIKAGEYAGDARYVEIDDSPGFGLAVIDEITRDRALP